MRKKICIVLALVNIIFSASIYAGAIGSGKVEMIGGQPHGQVSVYFGINPPPTNKAPCNTHSNYHFVFDPTTDGGKALYSMLLTAEASDKTIRVNGTGNCILGLPMEEVNYWIMNP